MAVPLNPVPECFPAYCLQGHVYQGKGGSGVVAWVGFIKRKTGISRLDISRLDPMSPQDLIII